MKELMLTVFAATFFSTQIIVIAIIVIALIVIIGAVFVLRSGKNKKGAAVGAPGSNADWQRQQPGAGQPGAWNQQAGANSWGQPGQPAQQAGAWGAPNTAGQANSWGTQQPNNPWGAPAQGQQPDNPWATANPAQAQQPDNPWAAANPAQAQQSNNPWAGANPAQAQAQQPDPWGTPNPAQAQQSNNPWGAPNTAQPQQPNNPWAAANPAQSNNAWGATASPAQPQQPNNPWGAQGQGGQSSWEAAPAGAPAAQDAWGQTPAPSQQDPWRQGQAGAAQQPWGGAGAAPQGQNNGYGANTSGASWGQPQQPADPWAAQQAAQMPGGAQSGPSWQQGNMGQQGYAMSDNDKTMLRPGGAVQGPQAGLGYVRVEEGKEPGRTYEVRKESLSIGRSRESDIFLEDLAVSRLHASVVNMGNGNYALKDEGSANGTKVNGQLVNKFQTYPLQEGDRIQLGQTVLVFGRK